MLFVVVVGLGARWWVVIDVAVGAGTSSEKHYERRDEGGREKLWSGYMRSMDGAEIGACRRGKRRLARRFLLLFSGCEIREVGEEDSGGWGGSDRSTGNRSSPRHTGKSIVALRIPGECKNNIDGPRRRAPCLQSQTQPRALRDVMMLGISRYVGSASDFQPLLPDILAPSARSEF